MSRISRSQQTQRIHQNYVNRMTNISNADYIERVERLDPATSPNNENSENFLLSYGHFYETISDLKSKLKEFYHFSTLQTDLSAQLMIEHTTTFIKKYNKLITALHDFDAITNTNHVLTFHLIFTSFSDRFSQIGINERNNYTLSFDSTQLINNRECGVIDFIQQFKVMIVQEYQSFYDDAKVTPFVLKGLIIEEKR